MARCGAKLDGGFAPPAPIAVARGDPKAPLPPPLKLRRTRRSAYGAKVGRSGGARPWRA
jgi:hypothetical protein